MNQALINTIVGLFFSLFVISLQADEAISTTVENLYKEKTSLNGKLVKLQGKVVKVNNEILQRNFLHLQDGTGSEADGTDDITITSKETANVGDQVTVTGTLVLDHDFGAGYTYPMLVEKASISH
ncbi:MAG: hypothetical protein KZQ88_06360 [Candidatus Thiodiazotropha sp. (ex Dulcina madagascariensis)]|nr:hypothetical protein [Candidatus Thiodiazotropha sp. (ex Dulcina madagascariensis)]MCU7928042.1 hypothetical protein [Candidatus Thiodiazotropha sp. (ex Dulcina madagascariensis)]